MNRPTAPEIQSDVRRRVSPEEWQTRVDLAACYRLLAHYGSNDLTYNHLSARVPGEPHHLLIKPPTMMFEEVTASSLWKFDFDGRPQQDGPPLVGGGLVIHAGILQARPDLHAVFHTHTPAIVGVSSQQHGLLMINQQAVTFHKRLAYHTFGGFEFNLEQREPLIRDLGRERIMLLRNHGALVCGRSVPEAFFEHHFLEMACRGQISALAGGAPVTLIAPEVCDYAVSQAQSPTRLGRQMENWPACLRQARRLDPSFED